MADNKYKGFFVKVELDESVKAIDHVDRPVGTIREMYTSAEDERNFRRLRRNADINRDPLDNLKPKTEDELELERVFHSLDGVPNANGDSFPSISEIMDMDIEPIKMLMTQSELNDAVRLSINTNPLAHLKAAVDDT
jgi:hypothetical protein